MKRILSIALAAILLLAALPACYADIDLSGMSFEELVALKDQINLAIWNSKEWQEVEVPQGIWEVGADIPAGKWTISPVSGGILMINVGDRLEDGGTDVSFGPFQSMKSPENQYYKPESDVSSWSIDLEVGQYVKVSHGPAVFTPFSGKPSLGFK